MFLGLNSEEKHGKQAVVNQTLSKMFCNFKRSDTTVATKDYNPNQLYFQATSYKRLEEFNKINKATMWQADHVNITRDCDGFKKLSDITQTQLISILVFFANAEYMITEALESDFKTIFQDHHIAEYLCYQEAFEREHARTYAKILSGIFKNSLELKPYLDNIPGATSDKIKWMRRWFSPETSILEKVVAMVCSEGILFQSSFAFIFKLQHDAADLPGIVTANEYISRDEANHCQFFTFMFNKLVEAYVGDIKLERFDDIFAEAIDVECKFIEMIFKEGDFCGISLEDVKLYIHHVGNIIKRGCHLPTINTTLPTSMNFMVQYSLPTKHNFFETQPTEYISGVDVDLSFIEN